MGRENIKVVTAKMWQHVNTHVNINKFLCFYHKTEIYYTKKKYLHWWMKKISQRNCLSKEKIFTFGWNYQDR